MMLKIYSTKVEFFHSSLYLTTLKLTIYEIC